MLLNSHHILFANDSELVGGELKPVAVKANRKIVLYRTLSVFGKFARQMLRFKRVERTMGADWCVRRNSELLIKFGNEYFFHC